jgi:hypothetical protein
MFLSWLVTRITGANDVDLTHPNIVDFKSAIQGGLDLIDTLRADGKTDSQIEMEMTKELMKD